MAALRGLRVQGFYWRGGGGGLWSRAYRALKVFFFCARVWGIVVWESGQP